MWIDRNLWRPGAAPAGGEPARTVQHGFDRILEKDKAGRVQQHFDVVAARYDFMNTLLSFGIHYLWKRTAVQMLAPSPGERVLDVCGGTGDLARLAADSVGPDGRVVVYDFNRRMMRRGRAKAALKARAPRLAYVQGDAQEIAFPAETFDAAMVGFGIRNLTRLEKGFAEMYRVLKPGGRMMCLEFSKPRAPFFCRLYDLYSFYVMPFLGELITGSRQAYLHLPETIRMFPMPDDLSRILAEIGFRHTRYRRLTNGIAVVHWAEKDGGGPGRPARP